MRRLFGLFTVLFLVYGGTVRADSNDIHLVNTSSWSAHHLASSTQSFTPGTGSNGGLHRYLLVEVSVGGGQTVNSVTFAGTGLLQIGFKADPAANGGSIYMFEWPNWNTTSLPTTAGNLVVTMSNSANFVFTATVFDNVGSHTIGSANGASTNAGANEPSVTVTTVDRDLVVDAVEANTGTTTLTSNSTDTSTGNTANVIWNFDSNANGGGGAEANLGESILEGGSSGSITMKWTLRKAGNLVADQWAILALVMRPFTTPTAINLFEFGFEECTNGNLLNWHTAMEFRTLGFNIYRETSNGKLEQANSHLISGSFMNGTGLFKDHSYGFRDSKSEAKAYWLEEVDLKGTKQLYGPAIRETETGKCSAALPEVPPISRHPFTAKMSRVLSASEAITGNDRRRASSAPANALNFQWQIAANPAAKVFVDHDGWYKISAAEITKAGLSPTDKLRMYNNGREVQIVQKDGIEFYGVAIDTAFTGQNVYWLTAMNSFGARSNSNGTNDSATTNTVGSFLYGVESQDRLTYASSIADRFFGEIISAKPVDVNLTITHLAESLGANITLSIQGGGDTGLEPHSVSVKFNGTTLGQINFTGRMLYTQTFSLPPGALKNGSNTVTMASGDENDLSVVDFVRITYNHTFDADDNLLEFPARSGESATIGGFSTADIRVFDITDPLSPRELNGNVASTNGGFAVTVQPSGSGTRTLLALTGARISTPIQLVADTPSHLSSGTNKGKLLIIAHHDFLNALSPLVTLHQSEGLSVKVADVEDVYDEFGFGVKSAEAIKDFVSYARTVWQEPPQWVLLVGDASFDPRGYLGLGKYDFVPTRIISTAMLYTASDDWFVDPRNTGVPEIGIGRLPARTSEDATAMVQKIVGYPKSLNTGSWLNRTVAVSDASSDYDFHAAAQAALNLVPQSFNRQLIDRASGDANARSSLANALNEGALLFDFVGHGSVGIWTTGNLLTSSEARGLENGQKLPIVVSMTCLNGFFHDLYTDSLAEALIGSRAGGAVAVWASSTLTPEEDQVALHTEFLKALFDPKTGTLGEAGVRAKNATPSKDVRRSWILFGDPAMKIPR